MADRNSLPAGAPPALRGDVEAALDELRDRFVTDPMPLPDGSSMIYHAADMQGERIPALNPVLPEFVQQRETMVEPDSFIAYLQAFASSTAICRAVLAGNRIEAVLDYHGRSREGERDTAVPHRGAHVAVLLCPFDIDYKKWRDVFGKPFDQQGLADFIEDVIHTIGEPPAADLLEAIADLRIERAVRFKSGRNQRNGTIQFVYEEVEGERPAEGTVTLPDAIEIVVPIYQGGPLTQLSAKLRYSMDKGQVAFRLVVPGIDKLEREAFRSIAEHVQQDTWVPVFYTAAG